MIVLHTEFARAYVRGARPDAPDLPDPALLEWAREEGLRLHRFKRTMGLPRVRRIIGFLRAVAPSHVVDLGTGRGTALWPILDALPHLAVTAIERHPERAERLDAVARGGVERLTVLESDVGAIPLPDDSADVVTALEVLEHLPDPLPAAREALRISRCHVAVTVPSQPDDNPEHLRLFTPASLEALLREAGATRVQHEAVRGHLVAFAR